MINSMKKRILSSLILLGLLYFLISLDNNFFLVILSIIFIIIIYELNKIVKKNISKLIWFIYIIFSLYTVYAVKIFDDNSYLFILILFISISTDIGGYIIGKTFGGPRLTKISPSKTYSGALGGILFTLIFGYIFINYTNYDFIKFNKIDLINVILLILLSISSQIGDLIISFLKRKSDIKDTGNIIPGHGGILDRVDGMIFVFPTFYLIDRFFF
tara:strand:+ start:1388 stop:2032 length:645 start_codon:yes stop_codon:yes gene_type:complete